MSSSRSKRKKKAAASSSSDDEEKEEIKAPTKSKKQKQKANKQNNRRKPRQQRAVAVAPVVDLANNDDNTGTEPRLIIRFITIGATGTTFNLPPPPPPPTAAAAPVSLVAPPPPPPPPPPPSPIVAAAIDPDGDPELDRKYGVDITTTTTTTIPTGIIQIDIRFMPPTNVRGSVTCAVDGSWNFFSKRKFKLMKWKDGNGDIMTMVVAETVTAESKRKDDEDDKEIMGTIQIPEHILNNHEAVSKYSMPDYMVKAGPTWCMLLYNLWARNLALELTLASNDTNSHNTIIQNGYGWGTNLHMVTHVFGESIVDGLKGISGIFDIILKYCSLIDHQPLEYFTKQFWEQFYNQHTEVELHTQRSPGNGWLYIGTYMTSHTTDIPVLLEHSVSDLVPSQMGVGINAAIYTARYCRFGKLHNDTQPAHYELRNAGYAINGVHHRKVYQGPAYLDCSNASISVFMENGQPISPVNKGNNMMLPAVSYFNSMAGHIHLYYDEKNALHRDNGPAFDTVRYFTHVERWRSVVRNYPAREYWDHGQLHCDDRNEDGVLIPAVLHTYPKDANGRSQDVSLFYIDGEPNYSTASSHADSVAQGDKIMKQKSLPIFTRNELLVDAVYTPFTIDYQWMSRSKP